MQQKNSQASGSQHSDAGSSNPNTGATRRPARSKNGCVTCRSRKVRCDETRPRCSHCFRLNLECRWRPPASPAVRRQAHTPRTSALENFTNGGTNGQGVQLTTVAPGSLSSPSVNEGSVEGVFQPNMGAVDQMFDYASFMWDAMPESMSQFSPDQPQFDLDPNGMLKVSQRVSGSYYD